MSWGVANSKNWDLNNSDFFCFLFSPTHYPILLEESLYFFDGSLSFFAMSINADGDRRLMGQTICSPLFFFRVRGGNNWGTSPRRRFYYSCCWRHDRSWLPAKQDWVRPMSRALIKSEASRYTLARLVVKAYILFYYWSEVVVRLCGKVLQSWTVNNKLLWPLVVGGNAVQLSCETVTSCCGPRHISIPYFYRAS